MNALLPFVLWLSRRTGGESQLRIEKIEVEGESIVISVSPTDRTCPCPLCGTPSDRIHNYYQRQPADLPLAGCAVRLDMNVRRFFCDNNDCERAIFTGKLFGKKLEIGADPNADSR